MVFREMEKIPTDKLFTPKKIVYIGYDPGTGFGTAYTSEKMYHDDDSHFSWITREKTLPNMISLGSSKDLLEAKSKGPNTKLADVLDPGDIVVGYAGKEYYLGDLAEDGKNPLTAKGSAERYSGMHSLVTLFALAGSLFKEDTEFRLVTGGPISLYDDSFKARVKANLEGTYTYYWNGEERHLKVKVGGIVREGSKFVSLYGLKVDKTSDVRQAFVDIGERTMDIGQYRGTKILESFCVSEEYGVGKVLDGLIHYLKKKHKYVLKLSEARKMLKQFTAGEALEDIFINGVARLGDDEIKDVIIRLRDDEFTSMLTFIESKWNEEGGKVGTNIRRLVLGGGGSYLWFDQFKERFPQTIRPEFDPSTEESLESSQKEDAPLIGNAKAYHRMAREIEQKPDHARFWDR